MTATSRGLIVRPPWLGRIVLHGKTWEIRGGNTKVRGRIALVWRGLALGEVDVVGSFPLTRALFDAHPELHHVPDWAWVAARYANPHVWLLANPRQVTHPVARKPGQVTWVKIEPLPPPPPPDAHDMMVEYHDLQQAEEEREQNAIEDAWYNQH